MTDIRSFIDRVRNTLDAHRIGRDCGVYYHILWKRSRRLPGTSIFIGATVTSAAGTIVSEIARTQRCTSAAGRF
ncbi:hypothetical protein [Paenibacillus alkalitolerans]|uniref:hypothetical protein n=1 Tax=Paenibacillus alkalitolerans TaxID=2799335 RepID=UPI0018F3F859|nr:hypothetical protein [Paenibacillus alkalitolerans]